MHIKKFSFKLAIVQISFFFASTALSEVPDEYLKCEKDTDCVETSSTGCGCGSGGDKITVNKASLKRWEERYSSVACTDNISNHSSCSKRIICEKQRCKLQR